MDATIMLRKIGDIISRDFEKKICSCYGVETIDYIRNTPEYELIMAVFETCIYDILCGTETKEACYFIREILGTETLKKILQEVQKWETK